MERKRVHQRFGLPSVPRRIGFQAALLASLHNPPEPSLHEAIEKGDINSLKKLVESSDLKVVDKVHLYFVFKIISMAREAIQHFTWPQQWIVYKGLIIYLAKYWLIRIVAV